MTSFRISEAAALLGVSDDTVRRWADAGRLELERAPNGMRMVTGTELVRLLGDEPDGALADAFPLARASARNRMLGLVTAVERDGVMARVELRAGPFRIVSLMSREAADDLGLEPGCSPRRARRRP
ncbi:MerR family transcriptional regulator [Agromyces marinus]|uniref:MerR family transcriptional regulator n=1 Tax=Agromyces marinus TaxID=1389020 RepID=A0ABM8H2Z5_9MICO|nr:MerR family transcriptional regulator [Agromyces marinus]